MASRKQIRANRRNARKSTGPRSEAGKAASSANALSHGLTAARTVVLPEEEPEAFERLSQGVVADLAPAGALQQALAQRIAGLLWRLDRVARLEAELFAHGRLARRRDALARSGTQGLVSRVLAEHLGDKAQESQGELDEMRQRIDMEMQTEAPSARVLVERKESARAYDQLARHEATLQRALDRTLAAFHRLRDAAATAAAAEAVPEAAPADPGPAPSRDARPPASQSPRVPAGRAVCGGETEFSQSEPNSAQRLEGEERIAAGAPPPPAPPAA